MRILPRLRFIEQDRKWIMDAYQGGIVSGVICGLVIIVGLLICLPSILTGVIEVSRIRNGK